MSSFIKRCASIAVVCACLMTNLSATAYAQTVSAATGTLIKGASFDSIYGPRLASPLLE